MTAGTITLRTRRSSARPSTTSAVSEDRRRDEELRRAEAVAEYLLHVRHPRRRGDRQGGDVPGNFGGMFLGHTTDPFGERAPAKVTVHTARFFSSSNPYPAGDPANDTQRYDLLQSGVIAARATATPNDFRYCFSAGPFAKWPRGTSCNCRWRLLSGGTARDAHQCGERPDHLQRRLARC